MSGLITTEFTPRTTKIPGLLVFKIANPEDERGWVQEKFQKAKLVDAGLPSDFNVIQNTLSYNPKIGATRGIHAEPWDKYISVITGKVFAAYVDMREGDSFGLLETVEIDSHTSVFLPMGVGNSFQSLLPDTYYLYSINGHWSANNLDQYTYLNLADPALGIDWPIPLQRSIISEKDHAHPMLSAVKPIRS